MSDRNLERAQHRHDSRAEPGHPRLEERYETCPLCRVEPSGMCHRCQGWGFLVRWVEIDEGPAEAGKEATR